MSSIAHSNGKSQAFTDFLSFEETRQDIAEAVDHAARWGFHVYNRIVAATGDSHMAGEVADKVQSKLLQRAGVDYAL